MEIQAKQRAIYLFLTITMFHREEMTVYEKKQNIYDQVTLIITYKQFH